MPYGKSLLLVTYRNISFKIFISNSRTKKNNNNNKFDTLFFNMTRSIEIKFNTTFNTSLYDMYNYDIKYNVKFFI